MESGRDEVLVQENQAESISAIDYSYNDKCLYWADNSLKKIQVHYAKESFYHIEKIC